MVFAKTTTLLKNAQAKRYAVGHFNINNMEIAQAVINAAIKSRSPAILATTQGAINYAGLDYLLAIAKVAATQAKKEKIPVALHLDHGRDLDLIKRCVRAGYSSVMIDMSHKSFKENIALTKRIVSYAHKRGVSVEAELGTIGGVEDTIAAKKILYTDPDAAQEFVEQTNCDFLAVAIGTSHGAYKFLSKRAQLRIELLKKIRKKVTVPLVLHGASAVPRSTVQLAQRYGAKLQNVKGVPEAQVAAAIKAGICKINTDTDLRLGFDAAIRRSLHKRPQDFDPRHILAPARTMMQELALQRMMLFRSNKRV